MTVQEAADSNFIKLKIQGLYGFETYKNLDHSGAYFGECLALDIQNITDTVLVLTIPVGTYLICEDTSIQNMVVTKTAQIELTNYVNNKYKLFAMCGEIHDGVPQKGNYYTIDGFAEEEVVRLARVIEERKAQNHEGQIAMWAVANNVDSLELIEYMSNKEIDPVLELLEAADVKVKFNEHLQNAPPILPDTTSNQAVEKIVPEELKDETDNLTIVLAISTGVFFITSLILSLFLRKRKKATSIKN